MKKEVRKIQTVSRLETGPLQNADDWPGLFIRGDDCIRLALTIQEVLAALSRNGKLGDPDNFSLLMAYNHLLRIQRVIQEDVVI